LTEALTLISVIWPQYFNDDRLASSQNYYCCGTSWSCVLPLTTQQLETTKSAKPQIETLYLHQNLINVLGKQYLYRSSIRRSVSFPWKFPTCLPQPSSCCALLQFSVLRIPCTSLYPWGAVDPRLWTMVFSMRSGLARDTPRRRIRQTDPLRAERPSRRYH
jgi:hypothetical protein